MELNKLKKSEQAAYRLRDIYEQYGYEKYRMSRFEEYDFYVKNRDFLGNGQILAFTDLSGRLMALKPDVTMSIVKNTRATKERAQKLYYSESVYRANPDAGEFREITQIGVEHIGAVDLYTQAQMIALCLKSLEVLDDKFVLDIGHAGFFNELLEGLSVKAKQEISRHIENKSAHELRAALNEYGAEPKTVEGLLSVLDMSGAFPDAVEAIRPLIKNEVMECAYDELHALSRLFTAYENELRLDFSITGNSKYYNGLLLRGYVSGIPYRVLSGGRYDPLITRMGRSDLQGIGFAVYFDEVERSLKSDGGMAYDAVVLYDEETALGELHSLIEKLTGGGLRVYAAKTLPQDAVKAEVYDLTGGVGVC